MASQKICDKCGQKEKIGAEGKWLAISLYGEVRHDNKFPGGHFDLCQQCGKKFGETLEKFLKK